MKTPYYIIHQDDLDFTCQRLIESVKKYWSRYIIGYSYKTNALPWVISHLENCGCFAEVVSADEYELAKFIGTEKKCIIYNGPIKSKDTFIEALNSGAIVNIDAKREIEWLRDIPANNENLGIRVNFDIEKMCPGQSQCGNEGGRFGFCYENGELEKAMNAIKEAGHKITGLHLHTSSKSRGLDIYKAIAMVACEIAEKYSLALSFIDIGGGFFGGLPTKPQFDEYMALVTGILRKTFSPKETTLIIEPGMALIGPNVSYVTTVIDTKTTEFNHFIVTDGTRTSVDPLMTKSSYFYEIDRKSDRTNVKKQVICGYTCMEHDRLFVIENEPELAIGDKIIYHKVGAYTMCLTPLFIRYFPDVYVEKAGAYTCVRNCWKAKEYVQNSIVEQVNK